MASCINKQECAFSRLSQCFKLVLYLINELVHLIEWHVFYVFDVLLLDPESMCNLCCMVCIVFGAR